MQTMMLGLLWVQQCDTGATRWSMAAEWQSGEQVILPILFRCDCNETPVQVGVLSLLK